MDDAIYQQLRQLAAAYFRGQSSHTLQPTALVHEAYLRLAREHPARFTDRDHFFAVAALAMRQILTDHARRRLAQKRGGHATRITLDGFALADPSSPGGDEGAVVDVIAVDDALTQLAALSPRQAKVIELQFYGGLTADEIARALDVSLSLVEKESRRARAWMQRALTATNA